MIDIQRRFYVLLISIFLTVLGGSIGYFVLLEGAPRFIDCIYMTVISLTGVGYGEAVAVSGNPVVQIYTMLLIIFGMGVILYAISTFTALLVEGELTGIIRGRSMEKRIRNLSDHYIVCGTGETGQPLVQELIDNNKTPVLIDIKPEQLQKKFTNQSILFVDGDATDDQNLMAAGIERASGIIITLPSDKDNLYITMTARMLNPDIKIISRMTSPKMEEKLYKAGADRVVSPNAIGALRMASEMIRPATVSFLDTMLRHKEAPVRIHDLVVTRNSPLVGKKIKDTDLRTQYDLLILGAQKDGEMSFNPGPNNEIVPDMTLIVMGRTEDILRAQRMIKASS